MSAVDPKIETLEAAWVEERAEFYLQSGTSFENPHGVHPDELLAMLINGAPEVSAQTVLGMYVPSSGLVFASRLILNLLQGEVVNSTLWHDDAHHRLVQEQIAHYGVQSGRFKGGVDLARKKDSTVIYVLDTLPLSLGGKAKVVYYRSLTRVPWEVVYSAIGRASWLWNSSMKLDSTGAGDVILGELKNRRYCPEHNMTLHIGAHCTGPDGVPLSHSAGDEHQYHRLDCTGYEFTARSKVQLVTHLSQVLGYGYDEDNSDREFGRIEAPAIGRLRKQMGGYMWDDAKLDTDEVMALALAAWAGVRDLPGDIAAGHVQH